VACHADLGTYEMPSRCASFHTTHPGALRAEIDCVRAIMRSGTNQPHDEQGLRTGWRHQSCAAQDVRNPSSHKRGRPHPGGGPFACPGEPSRPNTWNRPRCSPGVLSVRVPSREAGGQGDAHEHQGQTDHHQQR